jgi:hypothetical protein
VRSRASLDGRLAPRDRRRGSHDIVAYRSPPPEGRNADAFSVGALRKCHALALSNDEIEERQQIFR